jgi:hypothetical protein
MGGHSDESKSEKTVPPPYGTRTAIIAGEYADAPDGLTVAQECHSGMDSGTPVRLGGLSSTGGLNGVSIEIFTFYTNNCPGVW